jgi:ComF family protein
VGRWGRLAVALRGAERWLLPPECLLCGAPVGEAGEPLACALCRSRWRPLPEPVCPRCGQPGDRDIECRICLEWPAGFGPVRSAVWLTGSARAAVHHLKYGGWHRLADALARPMLGLPPLRRSGVLVPVPLGAARLRSRGYNQCDFLAQALARRTTLPVRAELLRRGRETTPQTGLTPEARHANLAGAFRALPASDRVVLVDDVFTTGATLAAAAAALLAAGAERVEAVTFARARRPLDDEVETLSWTRDEERETTR